MPDRSMHTAASGRHMSIASSSAAHFHLRGSSNTSKKRVRECKSRAVAPVDVDDTRATARVIAKTYTRRPFIRSPGHALFLEKEAMTALRASGLVSRTGQHASGRRPAPPRILPEEAVHACEGPHSPPYATREPLQMRDAHVSCKVCGRDVCLPGPFWRYVDRLHTHVRRCTSGL